MGNFVLVAGARLGAWAWADVVPHLQAAGHTAHALTLSGMAEKHGMPAGPQSHVRDIIDEIAALDLDDVILVGHSYAGIPVGQAAGRLGARLRRVVFVDASVPVDGRSFLDGLPDGGAQVVGSLAASGGFWAVPPAEHFAGEDLTDEQIAKIVAGSTPHPGQTLMEPAVVTTPLDQLPAAYIKSSLSGTRLSDEVLRLLASDSWQYMTLETGHWPMFSKPRDLAALLIGLATVS